MSTQADIDRVLAEYDPDDGDPGLADLMRDHLRAGAVDPDAVTVTAILVTGAEAMTLPSPETVLRLSALSLNRPPIVSIGEPAILAAPGGAGKSYLALSLMAQATRAGEADRDVFSAQSDAWASALGFELRRGPMLLISYEDSCGRIGERLGRIGAPRETLDHLHIWDDPPGAVQSGQPRAGAGRIPSGGIRGCSKRVIRDVRPVARGDRSGLGHDGRVHVERSDGGAVGHAGACAALNGDRRGGALPGARHEGGAQRSTRGRLTRRGRGRGLGSVVRFVAGRAVSASPGRRRDQP